MEQELSTAKQRLVTAMSKDYATDEAKATFSPLRERVRKRAAALNSHRTAHPYDAKAKAINDAKRKVDEADRKLALAEFHMDRAHRELAVQRLTEH